VPYEDEPSLPESFWNALRRQRPRERDVDRRYFRFIVSRSVPRPPVRVIHWLVFGFAAGVAAVSAAASGRFGILRWLPLVPHESRAASGWQHSAPTPAATTTPAPAPSNVGHPNP
jgi:hypothetical protein